MITRAQQQPNATATQLDSSNFFVRRPEEYERTLHDETQVGLDCKYLIYELIKLRFTRRLNFCQQREGNRNQIGLKCQIK